MKKSLIVSTFCLTALLLVSFQLKKPDVTKIGEKLYQVKDLSKMESADQEILKSMITKYYGIKDFSTKQKLEMIDDPNSQRKGTYLIEKTVMRDFFDKTVVVINDAKLPSSRDEDELLKLLAKYAQ